MVTTQKETKKSETLRRGGDLFIDESIEQEKETNDFLKAVPPIVDALRRKQIEWRVLLERDNETGDWGAWCPELPGCASAGESEDEALKNIREAIELYLQRDPIDLPQDAVLREVLV